jgi:hypothetical protein
LEELNAVGFNWQPHQVSGTCCCGGSW